MSPLLLLSVSVFAVAVASVFQTYTVDKLTNATKLLIQSQRSLIEAIYLHHQHEVTHDPVSDQTMDKPRPSR